MALFICCITIPVSLYIVLFTLLYCVNNISKFPLISLFLSFLEGVGKIQYFSFNFRLFRHTAPNVSKFISHDSPPFCPAGIKSSQTGSQTHTPMQRKAGHVPPNSTAIVHRLSHQQSPCIGQEIYRHVSLPRLGGTLWVHRRPALGARPLAIERPQAAQQQLDQFHKKPNTLNGKLKRLSWEGVGGHDERHTPLFVIT